MAAVATEGFLGTAGNADGDENASEDSGNGGDSEAGVAGTTGGGVGGFLSVDNLADDGADTEAAGLFPLPASSTAFVGADALTPAASNAAPAPIAPQASMLPSVFAGAAAAPTPERPAAAAASPGVQLPTTTVSFLSAPQSDVAAGTFDLASGSASLAAGSRRFLGNVLARPAGAGDESGTSGERSSQVVGFLAPTDAALPTGGGSTDDELRGERRLPDLRGGLLGSAIR